MLNIAGDSRSLRRINNTNNEMNNHGDSRALRRIKNAANQRKRRQDPLLILLIYYENGIQP